MLLATLQKQILTIFALFNIQHLSIASKDIIIKLLTFTGILHLENIQLAVISDATASIFSDKWSHFLSWYPIALHALIFQKSHLIPLSAS